MQELNLDNKVVEMNKRYHQHRKAFLMGVSSKLARSILSSTIKHQVKLMKISKKITVKYADEVCPK